MPVEWKNKIKKKKKKKKELKKTKDKKNSTLIENIKNGSIWKISVPSLKFAVKQNFSKNPKKRKSNDFETSQTEQN